jgi:DNA replication initiation complex subunit (GINS family)
MLTFETLRRIATEEKSSNTLTPLPEDFFDQVRGYMDQKSKLQEDGDRWEVDSARRLLQDILEMREEKILKGAMYFVRSGVETENLTPEEKILFERTVSNIKDFRGRRDLLKKPQNELIAVTQEIPEFVGTDMKNYGPLKEGDVVNLPEKVAKLIIKNGAGKVIEVK